MRVIIQRVNEARVKVHNETIGQIQQGYLIFLGISKDDTEKDIEYLVNKIKLLRIFEDNQGKMNKNIFEKKGEILLVSQFTLYADCRKGNRPSYDKAAKPDIALNLYNKFYEKLSETGLKLEQGQFGAIMDVELCNNGPVTIILDSNKLL